MMGRPQLSACALGIAVALMGGAILTMDAGPTVVGCLMGGSILAASLSLAVGREWQL